LFYWVAASVGGHFHFNQACDVADRQRGGALAGLGAGPLAHPPDALYLTYVISAWQP
jgi:hypothetical protein